MIRYINEQDGIELYVATAGLFVFLALAVLPIARHKVRRFFASRFVGGVGLVAAGAIVVMTRSTEFVGMTRPFTSITVFILATAGLVTLVLQSRDPLKYRRIVLTSAGVASVIILVSGAGPSPGDYGYFLGPALKVLQGERLGSFYMQYSLMGTGLFAGMMGMNFSISGMEFGIAVVTVVWFWMYLILANKLFADRQIGLLFFSALFIVRFLWLAYHPAVYPQVSPFRIDIWVPLMIVAWRFGFRSWRTAIAFAAGYTLDTLFGLFALCAYLFTILSSLMADWRAGIRPPWRDFALMSMPIMVAVLIQTVIFGGLVPQSAIEYQHVQVGFLPISSHSLFWPIMLALAFASLGILAEQSKRKKELGVFLIILCAFQLIYFFGRSHDHNLLNISGSWLLAFFLAWDINVQASSIRRRLIPPMALCALAAAAAGPRVRAKVGALVHHAVAMDPFPRQQVDIDIDSQRRAWPVGDSNVILFAADDAYWNYRLHLRQHGYFTPMFATLFRTETTTFLATSLQSGRRVVINETISPDWIAALNDDPAMVRRKQAFAIIPLNNVLRQLVLEKAPVDSMNSTRQGH